VESLKNLYLRKKKDCFMRKMLFTALAGVAFMLLSCSGEKVYNASDFGIVPNTGEDMTEEVAKAVETIKAERGGKPAVLLFLLYNKTARVHIYLCRGVRCGMLMMDHCKFRNQLFKRLAAVNCVKSNVKLFFEKYIFFYKTS
jgi:hypothetical protein